MIKSSFKRISGTLGANGVVLIVVAGLLLITIYIIMYQFTRDEINEDVKLRSESELLAKSLTIQSIMNEVESAIKNNTLNVEQNLNCPDSMYGLVKRIVELNPKITGSSISFIENYYPEKGKWFEPYAVKDSIGNIVTMQLGSENHDYFKSEFFNIPLKNGKGGWTDPYLDSDGAKMLLTTYSEPIFDSENRIVAVLDADISLDWLDEVLTAEYAYPSSYHVLLSKTGQLMSVADKDFLLKTIPEMGEAYGNPSFLLLNEGMLSGNSGQTIVIDKKGNKYLSFYMPVDSNTGWSIAILNSEKEIFKDFHKMRVIILWLSIAGFFILLVVIGRAIINIKRLEKVSAEKERIKSELQIASDIQAGMLPKSKFLEGSEEKIEVAAYLIPAKEVGGDLYDYFIKDNKLFFCIGDVSGKGVPASLFMAVTRSLFRALALSYSDPTLILEGMNNTLEDFNEKDIFVTIFLGVLDLQTGRLNFCNAGHDAPVILDNNGIGQLKVLSNLPLGVFPDIKYKSQMIQLRKGSLIFLYTDGLTEAMNLIKEEFGEKRMMDDLKSIYMHHLDITPEKLILCLKEKIHNFVGKAEQSDDLTMLAFKFYKSDNYIQKKIKIKNNIKEIPKLNKFVEEICKEQKVSDIITNELKLVIEEVVANCINYAYSNDEKGEIRISLKFQPTEILVEILDDGTEFDPTVEREVNLDTSLEEREIGGLGLFLVNQLTDSISYRRVGKYNILSLTKNYKN